MIKSKQKKGLLRTGRSIKTLVKNDTYIIHDIKNLSNINSGGMKWLEKECLM